MRFVSLSLALSMAAAAGCATSAQAQDWTYKYVRNQHAWVADFLNTECGPRDSSGVLGIIAQGGGRGGDYNVHVWCRRDLANRSWVNDPANLGVGAVDVNQVVHPRALSGRYAIIGFIDGQQQDAIIAVRRTQ